jgi:hypothetical protein
MSIRLRIALALASLLVIAASLLALAYAFWPSDTATDQFIPPPTLFAPPQTHLDSPSATAYARLGLGTLA